MTHLHCSLQPGDVGFGAGKLMLRYPQLDGSPFSRNGVVFGIADSGFSLALPLCCLCLRCLQHIPRSGLSSFQLCNFCLEGRLWVRLQEEGMRSAPRAAAAQPLLAARTHVLLREVRHCRLRAVQGILNVPAAVLQPQVLHFSGL